MNKRAALNALFNLFFFDRFDLIFLILDPQDEHFDRRLGTHLVSLYHMSEAEATEEDVVGSLY